MIEKAGVLLRVQYFEQRGCGIALIRSAYLVDLVEHDDRIRDAGFADVTLDTKGYRRGSLNEGIPEETLANG